MRVLVLRVNGRMSGLSGGEDFHENTVLMDSHCAECHFHLQF